MTKTFTLFLSFLFACFFTPILAQNFEIYISDAGNFSSPPWQILKFDENGENGEVFISDNLAWPQDIFFLESDNTMLVSNLNTGTISKFDATTGDFIEQFATGIGGPTRMKLGADGLLYVLQWQGNGKVLRYQLDGTFVDEFTETGVGTSIGLDWDAVGNLYVSSYSGDFVRKFSPDGANLGNFISSNLVGPTNIWFGENGDLFVVDYDGGSVKQFDSEGNFLGVFISGLPNGEGVDFLENGNIVIGSGGASSVRVYDSSGTYIEDLVPPGTLNLLTPNAVVFRSLSVSSTREVFKEVSFVTPTVGVHFQINGLGVDQPVSSLDVFNSSGNLVQKINLSASQWDASHLSNGVYFIATELPDGVMARQKIVVQH